MNKKKLSFMAVHADYEKKEIEKTIKFRDQASKIDMKNLEHYNFFIVKMRAPKKPVDYKAYGSRMDTSLEKK